MSSSDFCFAVLHDLTRHGCSTTYNYLNIVSLGGSFMKVVYVYRTNAIPATRVGHLRLVPNPSRWDAPDMERSSDRSENSISSQQIFLHCLLHHCSDEWSFITRHPEYGRDLCPSWTHLTDLSAFRGTRNLISWRKISPRHFLFTDVEVSEQVLRFLWYFTTLLLAVSDY